MALVQLNTHERVRSKGIYRDEAEDLARRLVYLFKYNTDFDPARSQQNTMEQIREFAEMVKQPTPKYTSSPSPASGSRTPTIGSQLQLPTHGRTAIEGNRSPSPAAGPEPVASIEADLLAVSPSPTFRSLFSHHLAPSI